MSGETEQCPCMAFHLDAGSRTENTCFCGDRVDLHNERGCLAQYAIDAPYDPELAAAALRLAEEWMKTKPGE